jgi:uncharacterized protein YndB with AHSA1/START domain
MTEITRIVETELPVEQLWELVADGDSWPTWMVDHADVDVAPGAQGTIVEDGRERTVRIGDVGDNQVSFTWWPVGAERLASTVELVVLPRQGGSALHVTERFPATLSALAATTAGMAWDIRTLLLVLRTALWAVAPSLV